MMSLFPSLLLVPLLLGTTPGADRDRCSLSPRFTVRAEQTTYFVGVALPDTVRAGPGAYRYPSSNAPSDSRPFGPIYGQRVRVERVGGRAAETVRQAFDAAASRDVVVVPWGYDSACDPIPWSWNDGFVEPGRRGFFGVLSTRLRDREHWVGDVPTFDAFYAYWQPYPWGWFLRLGYKGASEIWDAPSLSAAEYFDFYTALPTREEHEEDAFDRIKAWARTHPDLIEKFPARYLAAIHRHRH